MIKAYSSLGIIDNRLDYRDSGNNFYPILCLGGICFSKRYC